MARSLKVIETTEEPLTLTDITARCTLRSFGAYSQSKNHEDVPWLEGELAGARDRRIWREHLHKKTVRDSDGRPIMVPNGDGTEHELRHVCIPAEGLHQSLMAAAKYSKRQIPGQGKATWTAKFTSGIAILDDVDIGIDAEDTQKIIWEDVYSNTDGVRGSGKRAMRRFPVMLDWSATLDVHVLDAIITKNVFEEMVQTAGMYIGIGRFRPEKGGNKGRFRMTNLQWDWRPVGSV